MTERIVPAADKMVSLSDVNHLGIATMMVQSQGGETKIHKFAPYQLRYIQSRIEAILAKHEEESTQQASGG